jgi:hypothetical protein
VLAYRDRVGQYPWQQDPDYLPDPGEPPLAVYTELRPDGRHFDFELVLGGDPLPYHDAATTHAFYVANWCHDRLYELGFTGSAGA